MKNSLSTIFLLALAMLVGCKKENNQQNTGALEKPLHLPNTKIALNSTGTTYYVSPVGSDSNDGLTTSTPWQTITKVNSHPYNPNDQILFLGGATFNGTISIGSSGLSGGQYIKLANYGTGNATINGGSGGGVVETNQSYIWFDHLNFTGNWNSTTQTGNNYDGIGFYNTLTGHVNLGDVFVSNCNVSGFKYKGITVESNTSDNSQSGYATVTIVNNVVHDNGYIGIQTMGPQGTSGSTVYAFPNVYVAYNIVYNNFGISSVTNTSSGNGIRIGDAGAGTIEHNVAYSNGKLNAWSQGGPVGIWCFDSTNLVFQYNESYNNTSGTGQDGDGMDLDGGATHCTMQYNYTHGNSGSGILIWEYGDTRGNNSNNVIRYNVSENDATYGGIYAGITQGRNGSGLCNNNYYYNNTLYNTLRSALNVIAGGTNNVFYNNILYANNSALTIQCNALRQDVYFLSNNYYSGSYGLRIHFDGTNYTSLSSFQSSTGEEQYNGVNYGYNSDPKFLNQGNGGTVGTGNPTTMTAYELNSTSPMIDHAFNLVSNWGYNVGSNDFNGLSIPYNNAYDIGACEYH